MKASIIGGTGYSGVELIRLLQSHSYINEIGLYTSQKERQKTDLVYPHLSSLVTEYYEVLDIDEVNKKSDVVFLATPNGVCKNIVSSFERENCVVVDLSGDLRLKNTEKYEYYYKSEAADQEILNEACYALSEICREEIKTSKLISNPGCFPTAVLLGLAPLLTSPFKDSIGQIFIDAKTGVTGAGKSLSMATHFSQTDENMTMYKVHEHQHIPEVEQGIQMISGIDVPFTFTTTLVPLLRGIMATMYIPLTSDISVKQLFEYYQKFNEKEYFVRVRPYGSFPSVKEVRGSNFCDIGIKFDERTNTLVVSSVIDNLVKGAAGQAIQNMNIALGFDENIALQSIPLFP